MSAKWDIQQQQQQGRVKAVRVTLTPLILRGALASDARDCSL